MSINISRKAIGQILKIKKNNNIKHNYLRLGVEQDRVSDLFVQFYEFTKGPDDTDKVFQFKDIDICIDQKSYMFLKGMNIDFDEKNKIGLRFNISEIAHMCGCNNFFVFKDS